MEQSTLLRVLHEVVIAPDSPFIVLVASRAESHIEMVFNDIGISQSSILLNEMYRPENDIRLFTVAEFARIKATHPLGRRLGVEWPTTSIVDSIVAKSSGQFIYAATVLRFIASSTSSPELALQMVLGARPTPKRSPFAEVDALYAHILSQAEHWDMASDILVLHYIAERAKHVWSLYSKDTGDFGSGTALVALGYTEDEVSSFFSDLVSIIEARVSHGKISLHFYHASFQDFLYSPGRSGQFHVDVDNVANSLAPSLLLKSSTAEIFLLASAVFRIIDQQSAPLTNALMIGPPGELPWNNPDGVHVWRSSEYDDEVCNSDVMATAKREFFAKIERLMRVP